MSRATCPNCDGTGSVTRAVPGGSWNSYAGNWDYDAIERHYERAISHIDQPDPDDWRDARLTK